MELKFSRIPAWMTVTLVIWQCYLNSAAQSLGESLNTEHLAGFNTEKFEAKV